MLGVYIIVYIVLVTPLCISGYVYC